MPFDTCPTPESSYSRLLTRGTKVDDLTLAGWPVVLSHGSTPHADEQPRPRRFVVMENAHGFFATRTEEPRFWCGYYADVRDVQLAGSMIDALAYATRSDQ
jgi:hypothetical protein